MRPFQQQLLLEQKRLEDTDTVEALHDRQLTLVIRPLDEQWVGALLQAVQQGSAHLTACFLEKAAELESRATGWQDLCILYTIS